MLNQNDKNLLEAKETFTLELGAEDGSWWHIIEFSPQLQNCNEHNNSYSFRILRPSSNVSHVRASGFIFHRRSDDKLGGLMGLNGNMNNVNDLGDVVMAIDKHFGLNPNN